MADIFISYSHDDGRHVTVLVHQLIEQGWSVWWDRAIVSGAHWDQAIRRELKLAKCVIVVWSQASIASQFVKEEAGLALANNKLLAITFDQTAPPPQFSFAETTDLSRWLGSAEHEAFKRLNDGIRQHCQNEEVDVSNLTSKVNKNRSSLKVWGVTIGGTFYGFASGVIAQTAISSIIAVALLALAASGYQAYVWTQIEPKPNLDVVNSGLERAQRRNEAQAIKLAFGLSLPVVDRRAKYTSSFGLREHPVLGRTRLHNGVDWTAPTGTEVLAAADGTVEEAGNKGAAGKHVVIRHSGSLKSTYSHLHEIRAGLVSGMKINRGDVIGTIGTTGLTTAPHLHFSVLFEENFINPVISGQPVFE